MTYGSGKQIDTDRSGSSGGGDGGGMHCTEPRLPSLLVSGKLLLIALRRRDETPLSSRSGLLIM